MSQAADSPLPVGPGDVVGGRYRVERLLGRGGMGFVVAARHIELGQLVAIKLLLPAAAARPDTVERFVREARASGQLTNEHATRILDVGAAADTGSPFMVMEYLEGASLAAVLRGGRVPVGHAAAFIAQACEAIEEAHALGIVHRDIKPDNLFVTMRGHAALVKVLDFGISQIVGATPESERLTATTDVMGTPLYMSPEQMRSARRAEPRSDVWALGATLFELLTGQPPFPGNNVTEVCTRVLTREPPRPRHLRPAVPRGLESVVLRCLEKKPEKRFQTVRDLRVALAPFVYRAAPDDAAVQAGRASQADIAQAGTGIVWDSKITLARRRPRRAALWLGAAALALAGSGLVFAVKAAIRGPDRAAFGSAAADATATLAPAAAPSADPTTTATLPVTAAAPATATLPATAAAPATATLSAEKPTYATPTPAKPAATGRFKPTRK